VCFIICRCVAHARSIFAFSECRHVALKLFIGSKVLGTVHDDELNMYKQIEECSNDHPGRSAIRSLLDSFDIDGPNARHRCPVHPPLWETLLDVRHRNPIRRLPSPVMAFVLQRLFQALDFLHTECHVAHTDIKEGNILFGADESVFSAFEQEELNEPCPRKELEGRTIYVTREFGIPKDYGEPVLCDLGSAVQLGDGAEHREDIQPNVYRAPETILDIPWMYSVDIWNVGCMVSTNDPNERSRADPSSFIRRYGMHSRVSTCLPAKILSWKLIEAGLTLLR
jgi:serine/threonine-protein kinase SRPK3